MGLRLNKFVQEKDYSEDITFIEGGMAEAFDEQMIENECAKYGERKRLYNGL